MKQIALLTTLAVLTFGCQATGCGPSSNSVDGAADGCWDGSMDVGKDANGDTGIEPDAELDAGVADDGGKTWDAMYVDANEFTPNITEFDPGPVPENPFSSDFVYMGWGSVWYSFWDDYIFWASIGTGKDVSGTGYMEKNDTCFTRISTGKSYCMNVNLNMDKLYNSAIGDVYVDQGKAVWTRTYSNSNQKVWNDEFYYYDFEKNSVSFIVKSGPGIQSHGINKEAIIFQGRLAENKMSYKYLFATREIVPLGISVVPIAPFYFNYYVDNQDLLVITNLSEKQYYVHYDLGTNKEILIGGIDIIPGALYNGRFYGTHSDTKHLQPYYLDIAGQKLESVYETQWGSWLVSKCDQYVLGWLESVDAKMPYKFYLYDIETKIKREVKGIPVGDYAAYCGAGALAITHVLGSATSPMFMLNLKKAGYIKDGHVVPEAGEVR